MTVGNGKCNTGKYFEFNIQKFKKFNYNYVEVYYLP